MKNDGAKQFYNSPSSSSSSSDDELWNAASGFEHGKPKQIEAVRKGNYFKEVKEKCAKRYDNSTDVTNNATAKNKKKNGKHLLQLGWIAKMMMMKTKNMTRMYEIHHPKRRAVIMAPAVINSKPSQWGKWNVLKLISPLLLTTMITVMMVITPTRAMLVLIANRLRMVMTSHHFGYERDHLQKIQQ